MSSYFRFDVFFQLWERGPYARLNLFPEDSTRSRTNIWTHDIATRSRRHHRDIVWILDDVIEQRTELYTRFLAFWAFIDRFWKKYRMRINQFVCVIFDYCPSRSNLWNLSTSKGTFRCLENIFHSVTIDIRIHLDTRYRDAYMINGEQEEARKLRRANGRVVSLLIAPAPDLIQPRNRSSFDW